MTTAASQIYWNDLLAKQQTMRLDLMFNITGTTTVTPVPGTLTAVAAIAAQSTIDTFLGTTNEFLIAAFDATSMGTDAFAVIVDMKGQAKELVFAEAALCATTGVITTQLKIQDISPITATSLTTMAACGANGNLAIRTVLSGYDAASTGMVLISLYFKTF